MMIGTYVFYVDEGAVYDVWFYSDGEGYVVGRRTQVTYRSPEHHIEFTGKRRWQRAASKSGSPQYVDGCRAILRLDTGEGISLLFGVAV